MDIWWANVLIVTATYAVLALSLNLINGYGGMFSLGHHGFWALGAYATVWLVRSAEGLMPGDLAEAVHRAIGGWPMPWVAVLSAVFAMLVAAAGGMVIGIPCLRLRGDYLAIATLGFGEIVRIAVSTTDRTTLGGGEGISVPRVVMEVNAETRTNFHLLFLGLGIALVVGVALLLRNLIRSSRGRAIRAVAQDETAAGLLGIDPVRPKVTAFLLGSALAGLAGAFHAHYRGRIAPIDFPMMEMVKVFLIVVLGGLGSISGCIFASFVLVTVEQLLSRTEGWVKDWWQVEYSLVLVLLMIFRPRGIFGGREVHQVVRDAWRRMRGAREATA
jgi:branched-chain amino acid transport system permease protein